MLNVSNVSNEALLHAYKLGYRVSKEGEMLNPDGKKIGFNQNDYYVFKIRFDNKSRPIKVHRLQGYQKYGDEIFKEDLLIRHKNGNSLDNSYDNILIGTNRENVLDIPEEQRILNTKNSAFKIQKYSNELILYVRKLYANHLKINDIALKLKIPKSTVFNMVNTLYLWERIESNNIKNTKPIIYNFKDIDVFIPDDEIHLHKNKYEKNSYSNELVEKIREESKTKSYSELSLEYGISKGMISYFVTKRK